MPVVAMVLAHDPDDLEVLVAAAARGDEAAWQRLWAAIEPHLVRQVARPSFLARLGQREDDRRNIVVEVMARLRAEGFRRLAGYVEARTRNPQLRFLTWLRVVTKRVGIDYLRGHPDYLPQRGAGAWVDAEPLPRSSAFGVRPPITDRGTADELACFTGALPDLQRRALALWTQGESAAAIATALGLASAADGERLVRAGLERLRRRVRGGGS